MPAYDANSFKPPAPLARVALRDREKGSTLSDVPMLIDTGADVTLVPQGAVRQLDVSVDPKQAYELLGFDGKITLAQAVELDLLFLARNFRGRHLIIDQEIGILGRDVLNHLSLLFDGPDLSWSEQQPS